MNDKKICAMFDKMNWKKDKPDNNNQAVNKTKQKMNAP